MARRLKSGAARGLKPLWFVLALLFLAEAWLWARLEPMVSALLSAPGLRRLEAWLSARLGALSPWAALVTFAVPAVLLFPVKLAVLWMFATGHFGKALVLEILSKLAGLAISAWLFERCRTALLRLRWVAFAHRWLLATKAWAERQTRPAKNWLRRRFARGSGRLVAKIARLRQRMRRRSRPLENTD